ncbi:MAG: hypothetical protein ACFBSC_09625 [Microcoleaceae cyanobacterium]
MNLFPNNGNNHNHPLGEQMNGQTSSQPTDPLEKTYYPVIEDLEDVEVEEEHPDVKAIQRSFLFLIGIGLVIGIFLAAGVIYVLDYFDITAAPETTE